MEDMHRRAMLARLVAPIYTFREQLDYRLDALGALLDGGVDPLEIADTRRVKIEPFQNVGRERWYASWKYAPELKVAGDSPDEAKRNLVLRLRRYDPDE